MSRMTTLTALLTTVLWTAGSSYAKAERKADPSQLFVGSHCEVRTKDKISGNQRSWTIYSGTVKELSDESVTLHEVSLTQHSDRSPPLLGSIPYIRRFFKVVGVGRTQLGEREVIIPLEDIAWNEAVAAEDFRNRSEFGKRTAAAGRQSLKAELAH